MFMKVGWKFCKDKLIFWSISNLNFAVFHQYFISCSKNQVQNRLQKSSSSNLIFPTRFFKNQVQINRGNCLVLIWNTNTRICEMNTLCSFLVWLLNLKSISCFVQSIPSVIQRCNQDDVEKGSFIMQIIREVSLKARPCPFIQILSKFYPDKTRIKSG